MEPNYLEQAREIFATGRMIQERLFSLQVARAACCGDGRSMDLTVPQMTTVLTIRDRGQVTIKELAEALQVSAPAASAMVDRLVELGAVTREQNPVDRREVVVRASPLGEQTVNAMERHALDAVMDLLKKLGPERAQLWRSILREIRGIIREERATTEQDPADTNFR